MSTIISLVIVLATLAFGAVYPWGYFPLLVVAAAIGVFGLARGRGVRPGTRALAVGFLLVAAAIGAQLVPLPRAWLAALSPRTGDLLSGYDLAFRLSPSAHPLSINTSETWLAFWGVIAVGLYVIGLSQILSRRDLRRLSVQLMVFAALLAVAGIIGRQHNTGLVYGFWRPQEGRDGNNFGPFVNRNHFAGWMLMSTCLSIGALYGLIEAASRRIKPGLRNRIVWISSAESSRVILAAAAVAMMGVSLVWTLSRSGIISFTCGVLCFTWLVVRRRGFGTGLRVTALTALGSLLAVSVSWRGLDKLQRWFGDAADLLSRFEAWRDGWTVFRSFPVAGTGLNTYPDAMLFYQKHVLDYWMTHAHNDYLQLLAEGGVLVALPAAAAMVLLGLAIGQRFNDARDDTYTYWVRAGATIALVAIGIQETVEFSLRMPANAFLFATLAAIAIAPTEGAPPATVPTPRADAGRGLGSDNAVVIRPRFR